MPSVRASGWQTERICAYRGGTTSPAAGLHQCPTADTASCNGTGGWWQQAFPVTLSNGVVWTSPSNSNELMGTHRSLRAYGQYFATDPAYSEWWVTGSPSSSAACTRCWAAL